MYNTKTHKKIVLYLLLLIQIYLNVIKINNILINYMKQFIFDF